MIVSSHRGDNDCSRAENNKGFPIFIEDVYNRKRLYSSLSYFPPEEYKRLLAKNDSLKCIMTKTIIVYPQGFSLIPSFRGILFKKKNHLKIEII
jgi:hypothetical protein